MANNLITEIFDKQAVLENLNQLGELINGSLKGIVENIPKIEKPTEAVETINLIKEAEKQLTEVQKAKKQTLSELEKLEQKNAEILKQSTDGTLQKAEAIKMENAELRKTAKEHAQFEAIVGKEARSINEAQKQVIAYQKQLYSLNLTTDEGRKKQAEYGAKIQELNTYIKENTDVVDAQRRNVGNYGSALTDLNTVMDKGLRQGIKLVREELYQMEATMNSGVEVTAEMNARHQELKEKLAELTDIQGDVAAQAKILSDDYRDMTFAMEGVQLGVNVFMSLQSVMALVGGEAEELQKMMAKIIALQQILNTAQKLVVATNKDSIIVLNLKRYAQEALNRAELAGQRGAVGLARANKALAGTLNVVANNLGKVLGIAGVLVTAITGIISLVKKYNQAQKELNATKVESFVALQKEKVQINALFSSLLDLNTANEDRKKTIEEINKKYGEYLPNLLEEWSTLKEIEEAYNLINRAVLDTMKNKVLQSTQEKELENFASELEEVNNNILKYQNQIEVNQKRLSEEIASGGEQIGTYSKIVKNAQTELEKNQKRQEQLIAQTEKSLKNLGNEIDKVFAQSEEAYEELNLTITNYQNHIENLTEQSAELSEADKKKFDELKNLYLNDAKNHYESVLLKIKSEGFYYQFSQKNIRLRTKAENEYLQALRKFDNEVAKLFKKPIDEVEKTKNKTSEAVEVVDELAEALKRLQTEFSILSSKSLITFNNKIRDLNTQFLQGKLSVEEFEKAISSLQTKFNLESLKSELKFLESLNEFLTGEEAVKNQEKISKLKVQIQKVEVEELVKLRKKEAEDFAKSHKAKEDVLTSFDEKYKKSRELEAENIKKSTELIKQSIVQLKDQIMGDFANLMDISAQKELDRLQRLDEAYSKNYDSRRNYIEKTILDEQEKANALEKLDKERLDFEEKRNEKEAQIEKRRAKFDIAMQGAQSLSTVVRATAEMIKVATKGDGYTLAARIAAAIASGSSALGAIISMIAKIGTLPAYEGGGDAKANSPFIAGEKGAEIGLGKLGTYLFPKSAIYSVPEPVQILTHEKSKQYLQTNNNNYNKEVTIANNLRVEVIDNKRIRKYFKI